MWLAIDTATDWAGIALYDPEAARVAYEVTWWARRRHTATVLPRIHEALQDQGLAPRDLQGVAVALGPGSYTGLRVGLSLAKGIAVALDIPLVGVPTLDVVAYPYRHLPQSICAVIQAGRTRVCWAVYPAGDTRSPANGYHLDDVPTLAEVLRAREEPVFICGELTPAMEHALHTALGERARLASSADGLRRPAFLAELGHRTWQAGRRDDPATLTPIYLRHPGSSGP